MGLKVQAESRGCNDSRSNHCEYCSSSCSVASILTTSPTMATITTATMMMQTTSTRVSSFAAHPPLVEQVAWMVHILASLSCRRQAEGPTESNSNRTTDAASGTDVHSMVLWSGLFPDWPCCNVMGGSEDQYLSINFTTRQPLLDFKP